MSFSLKLLDQYWIDKNPQNTTDLCSHGLISLTVNEVVISDEQDVDWTVSTAALALLRTLNTDFIDSDQYPPLIPHCGQLGMIGCPISISWDVIHLQDTILLKNFYKNPSTNEKHKIIFEGLEILLPKLLYIRKIIQFADAIQYFFKPTPRSFSNDYEQQEHELFWLEFNKLLQKNRP